MRIKSHRPLLLFLSLSMFLCLLLCFPAAALRGAENGLILWLYRVLPALLPFFILSGLFLSTGLSEYLARFLAPILSPLFHCSPDGCFAIAAGFLSGFPVGAQVVAELVRKGRITKKEGTYLLPLCNVSGASFLTNYICATILRTPSFAPLLIAVLWGCSTVSALLLRPKERLVQASDSRIRSIPSPSRPPLPKLCFSFSLLDGVIDRTLSSLGRIGTYIVLFSVLSELLRLLQLPAPLHAGLACLLELTTGSTLLVSLPLSTKLRFVLVASFTAFGGLSAIAQTKSVLMGSGLPIAHYIRCKLLTALLVATVLFLILR